MKRIGTIEFMVLVMCGLMAGAAGAACTRDVKYPTYYFTAEQRPNYCGVASAMMVHQAAYGTVEANTLAYQDMIALDMSWWVRYGGWGANIPWVLKAVYDFTPYGWVFSEWEYVDPHEGIKGATWTLALYGKPVIISGNTPGGPDGYHYYVLNGYQTVSTGSDCSPYSGYPTASIMGIYILDPMWGSPSYVNDPRALYPNYLFRQGTSHPIDEFVSQRWHKIGADGDKKHRTVEKGCNSCWSQQGKTYENNTVRSTY